MSARRGSTASSAADDRQEKPGISRGVPVSGVRAGPLFIWAALQAVAIGLAASRVSLAAQYPLIGEFRASQLLLAVQLPVAAMLMPVLLTNWQSTLSGAFLAGFLQLAAFLLTDASPVHALPCVSFVMLWVSAIALLRWSFCGDKRSLTTGAGVLSAWVAGGPLLSYLGADLAGRNIDQILSGPLLPLLANWPDVPPIAWIWLGLLFGLAVGNRLLFQGILHRLTDRAA